MTNAEVNICFNNPSTRQADTRNLYLKVKSKVKHGWNLKRHFSLLVQEQYSSEPAFHEGNVHIIYSHESLLTYGPLTYIVI
jgi:hypothetical protein